MNEMLDKLPDTLTPQDLAVVLRRTRRRIYDLLDLNPEFGGIKNISVGGPKSARIVFKSDFIEWLKARERESKGRFVSIKEDHTG